MRVKAKSYVRRRHSQGGNQIWKVRVHFLRSQYVRRQGFRLIDGNDDDERVSHHSSSSVSPRRSLPATARVVSPSAKMRAEAKPFARYPVTAFVSCIFLLATFVLLLLVGISLTIIKPIYLVIFKSTVEASAPLSIATELKFGVWGVCATSNLYPDSGLCFGPQLGYDVPEYITDAVGVSKELVNVVEKALLTVLVLHPIAAGFAFFAFITSAFLGSHAFSIFSLVLSVATALLSSVVFAIDLALVIVAQNQVEQIETYNFQVEFGNGVWMILASVILVWGAVIALSARACYCMGVRRHPADKHKSNSDITARY